MTLPDGCKPDVLFIPPITSPVFTEDFEDFMPLGLLALSASLRESGISPAVFRPSQALPTGEAFQTAAEEILGFGARIIAFSTWCHSYPSSILLAEQIRALCSESTIVFGGPQATLLDTETLEKHSAIDYILRGEADRTIVDFARALLDEQLFPESLAGIAGLTFRCSDANGERIRRNVLGKPVENLDDLPLPAYDLVPHDRGYVNLDVGRGCPFECTYCTTNTFFSRHFRVKSIERIIVEMDHVYEKHRVSHFGFSHDMFTARRDWVLEFCARLKEHTKRRGCSYTWTCSARTDCVDEHLLREMARSGCQGVFFGIETGSHRMQQIIKKRLSVQHAINMLGACAALGISATASFIVGFPQETREDLEATLQAVLHASGLSAKSQISILSVQPGTPIHREFGSQLVFDGYFSDFSGTTCGLEEKKLIQSDPELFSSFYYIPTQATSRQTLIAVNRTVNDLKRFENTYQIIWPVLSPQLNKISLLDLVEDRVRNRESSPEAGGDLLGQLVAALSECIEYIKSTAAGQIPCYLDDVFLAEASIALMCKRFTKRQVLWPRQGRWNALNADYALSEVLISTGCWKVIETRYNLESVMQTFRGSGARERKFFRKGRYAYLVLPISERQGALFKLKSWQHEILSYLDTSIVVRDLLQIFDGIVDREQTERLLRKLARIGVVEFAS